MRLLMIIDAATYQIAKWTLIAFIAYVGFHAVLIGNSWGSQAIGAAPEWAIFYIMHWVGLL